MDFSKTLRDDRIWRYYSRNTNLDQHDVFVDLRFSGISVVDGKEYMNCYAWLSDKEFSEENIALIALLREENGKIFVRYIPEALDNAQSKGVGLLLNAPMCLPSTHDMPTLYNEDVLIFDENLDVGDLLHSTDNKFSEDIFLIKDIETIHCLGREYERFLFYGSSVVGNYGFSSCLGSLSGFIPYPDAGSELLSVDYWHLNKIFDLEGNILFDESEMTIDQVGVSAFNEDEAVAEFFYTLNGVRIDKPVKKGIYIRSRHFENGQTKTEKVII